jgi:hypothetical protein
MEAELVTELPSGDWQYEPKWDGLSAGETMFPPRAPFFFAVGPTIAGAAPAGKARLRCRTQMAFPLI